MSASDTSPVSAVSPPISAVPPDDKQVETTRDIAELVDDLASADNVRIRLELIVELDRRFGHWGDAKRWPGAKGKWTKAFGANGAADLETLQGLEIELGRVAHELLEGVRRGDEGDIDREGEHQRAQDENGVGDKRQNGSVFDHHFSNAPCVR
jgi:hypothetical protein